MAAETADFAQSLLDGLPDESLRAGLAIVPGLDGSVALEWGLGARRVDVLIEPGEQRFEFSLEGDGRDELSAGRLDAGDLRRLEEGIRWTTQAD